jgi:hypothetical protein
MVSYFQLYHNANASNEYSFSTCSYHTKEQPQKEREGKIWGENADIGYELTIVI